VDVVVRPIELPRDAARFVRSWWRIYEGDAHWVPPLIFERRAFLDPRRNPYFRHATIQCFMAWNGGRAVGTVAACVDHRQQEHEPGVGHFGFFEFVDDVEVAARLLEAATAYLSDQGMTRARGPANFNHNHEFGLLVDGFDTDPSIANPHNRDYYARIYEAIGLRRAMDWFAYWIETGDPPEAMVRIHDRVLARHPEIRLRSFDLTRTSEETELVWEVYNDAWSGNWGHTHLNRDEVDFMVKGLREVMRSELIWFAYMGRELAGVAITLPDYNQVVKPMNGRVFPFGWVHFLTRPRRVDAVRVYGLGIKKRFQHLPLGVPLYLRTWQEARKLGVRGADASLILETNHRMRGALERLGARIYKTYRTYEMPLA